MKKFMSRYIDIEDVIKFKWYYLYVFLSFIIFYLVISIHFSKYIYSVVFFVIPFFIFLLIEEVLGGSVIKTIQFLYRLMTSVFMVFLFSIIYSYFLSYIYESYMIVTGVINPLFVINGFLSNFFILLSTVIFIYFIFGIFIYSFFLLIISLLSLCKSKCFSLVRFVNSFLLFFLLVVFYHGVVYKNYIKSDFVNSIIKYFLYTYQYTSNDMGGGKYVCKELSIIEDLKKKHNLGDSEIKGVKVYPLFSENNTSYVVMIVNNRGDIKYEFGISECQKNLL